MKKVLALVMTLVLVLSLAACGGIDGSSNNKEIELTLDNYSKYLEIKPAGSTDYYNGAVLQDPMGVRTKTGSKVFTLIGAVEFYTTISGKSQNFNYNDVKVTGRLKGTIGTFKSTTGIVEGENVFDGSEPFDKEVVLECDITGAANYTEKYKLPNKVYTTDDEIECEFEVTSISGTVTPA